VAEGWEGWDEYAPFYDWENARTLGRRDVPFWRRLATDARGPILELGCGTGRVTLPLARDGAAIVGIDRSAAMLGRALSRMRRLYRSNSQPATRDSQPVVRRRSVIKPRWAVDPQPPINPQSATGAPTARTLRRGVEVRTPQWIRGDIRSLPFADRSFPLVIAPYGILQSLVRPRDLTSALASVARVVAPDGTFAIDLVPDVPNWREYQDYVQLRGRSKGAHVTLIESVTQDRARRITTFEQRFVERRGRTKREHRFSLTFRTLTVPQMSRQLERAGFAVASVLGDYRGRAWDARADVWIILAKRV
jgi:ubiquinone/menaquinone biosynthesis C-methylase UbiE